MAITIVAHASVVQSGAPTSAIDTTGADLLVFINSAAASSTPTDSKSNTWTAGTSVTPNQILQLYYVQNPTVGSGHTFNVSAAHNGAFAVVAVKGTLTAGSIDQSNTNSTNAANATISTGSITPTQSNEFIVAGYSLDSPSTTDSFSIDSGFTIQEFVDIVGGVSFGVVLATFIQGGAAAVNPTLTRPNTRSQFDAGLITSFKAAPFAPQLVSVAPVIFM